MYVCLDHSHSGSGWLCHFTSFSAFLGDAFLIALGCSHIPARLHCHPLSQSRLRKNASNLADLQQVLANQWQLTVYSNFGYGSIPIDTFLVGWTSIYQLFWGSLGTRVLTHPQISNRIPSTVSEYRFDDHPPGMGCFVSLIFYGNYVRRVAPFCIAGVVAIPTWNAENGCVARIIWSGLLKIPLVSPCFTTTKSRGTICVFASIKKPSQHVMCPTSTPLYTPMVYDTILYWCSGRKWDGP